MDTRDVWFAEIVDQIKDDPLAKGEGPAGHFPVQDFLNAIYRLHFENPSYAFIDPPVSILPALPLDDAWVEVYLRPGYRFDSEGNASGFPHQHDFQPDYSIRDVLQLPGNAVIFGDPGAGKTTILKWAARYLIRQSRVETPVPLFVPIDAFASWKTRNQHRSIFDFLWEAMLGLPREFTDHFRMFMEARDNEATPVRRLFCFLLDGPHDRTESGWTELQKTLDLLEPSFRVLLAIRPSQYSCKLPSWRSYCAVPLEPDSMRALIHDWLGSDACDRAEHHLCHWLDRYSDMYELCRIPFALSVLCVCFALPSSRIERRRPLARRQRSKTSN